MLLAPVLFLGLPAWLLLSAIQAQPLVPGADGLGQEDLGRIRELLEQHDPRSLRDGETREMEISESDLNLLLNWAVPHAERQALRVQLGQGSVSLDYSFALPDNPLGQFLNLSAQLAQDGALLALERLGFGNSALPGWLLTPVIAVADHYLAWRSAEYRDALAAVKAITVQPRTLTIVYQWQSGLAQRLQSTGRELLLGTEDRQRIVAYYDEIARQSRSLGRGPVSLDRLLQPLFALALQRSVGNNDAAAENRAMLLALGMTASGKSIEHLVGPEAIEGRTHPGPFNLTLGGRGDLARHFSVSAAITAAGGSALADRMGVFKEVDDSRGGSGFSFADLLADRAGVSLAELALGDRARDLQRYMANRVQEADYMPGFNDLPEGLMALEFTARYEDLDSAAYALVNSEIERRLGSCGIYRNDFQ
jgi:hypothetical protein